MEAEEDRWQVDGNPATQSPYDWMVIVGDEGVRHPDTVVPTLMHPRNRRTLRMEDVSMDVVLEHLLRSQLCQHSRACMGHAHSSQNKPL